ncbi:MAG: hypothetical protein WBG92_24335 [Thiohalocapsa sp.]
MHQAKSTFLCIILLIILAASPSVFARPTGKDSAWSIDLDGSARLTPAEVTYHREDGTVEVDGRIEKRRDYYGRIAGHVDIELLNADGLVLRRCSSTLRTFSPSRRNPRWASFHKHVKNVPAGVVQIRVTHRVGALKAP